MANPAPDALHARMLRKKKAHLTGVADVRRKLWIALLHAEDVLEQAPEHDPDLRIKAIHAMAQVSGQLLKAIEVGELELRLRRLEEATHGDRPGGAPPSIGAGTAQRPVAVGRAA